MKFYAPTKLSENIRETPEGFLLCLEVAITRTGELIYAKGETPLEADEEGKVIITRDDEAVFDAMAMASFEGKPLTIRHPNDFVTPDNWKDLAKGIIQNIRRGEGENKDKLLADVLVSDAIAIGLVKGGLREVSCGYDAEYIQTGKGRGKQIKIIGNHLALVEEGRAGEACAINDHKGKGFNMKFKDQFKKVFGMTLDEAMKDEDMQEKKDEKKDESKDESGKGYDEVLKMVKDLGEKLDAMKPKDEDKSEEKKDESKDDEAGQQGSLEDRMKSLEAAVAKLLKMQSGDEDGEESEDEDMEESEDEDMGMTGDTFARAVILSPGIKRTKDEKAMRMKALKDAYATKEGKKIIDQLSGDKKPTFDSAPLFIAASELMKIKRSGEFSKSKQVRDTNNSELNLSNGMSAEQMNERFAKHYAPKQ